MIVHVITLQSIYKDNTKVNFNMLSAKNCHHVIDVMSGHLFEVLSAIATKILPGPRSIRDQEKFPRHAYNRNGSTHDTDLYRGRVLRLAVRTRWEIGLIESYYGFRNAGIIPF
jgi:hypothetical protein